MVDYNLQMDSYFWLWSQTLSAERDTCSRRNASICYASTVIRQQPFPCVSHFAGLQSILALHEADGVRAYNQLDGALTYAWHMDTQGCYVPPFCWEVHQPLNMETDACACLFTSLAVAWVAKCPGRVNHLHARSFNRNLDRIYEFLTTSDLALL